MAIRLIALDIDGTLLDSRSRIPPENVRALVSAAERRIEVVLVTGRRFEFALPAVESLPIPLTFIVTNGAVIKTRQGETLYRRALRRDVAARVLERTIRFRETAAVVFDRVAPPHVVYERIDWEDPLRGGYFRKQRQFLGEIAPLETCLVEDPVQVMFTGDFATMRAVLALLTTRASDAEFTVTATEYEARNFSLVDVVDAGCTKGVALAEWARLRGIAREEILAIGDNLNDVEMLAYAGVGVVMGNAAPALLDAGWHVTRTHDDAGVAAAIDRFAPADRPGAGAGPGAPGTGGIGPMPPETETEVQT